MTAVPRARRLAELWRFYQAALINTAFGFGTFALLIWAGTNLYVAQIVAQLLGMAFNYFTYSRHVFRDAQGDKVRFVFAYATNYLVNLAFLWVFHQLVRLPHALDPLRGALGLVGIGQVPRLDEYVAGLLATVCASLVNYFALKHVVFARKVAG